MKFEITANEMVKTVEMLRMFGVPDMDVETMNAAIKPLFTELTDTAGKVLDKISNVFKTPTRIEVVEHEDGIIIVARYNNGSFTIPCFSGKLSDVEAEEAVRNCSPTLKASDFVKRNDFRIGVYNALMEDLIKHRYENGTLCGVDIDAKIADLEKRLYGKKHED